MVDLIPFALKDAPALIESVFPAQKVSFESQRERNAGSGQTLTALGSYWKGRKPLILVRAIILGSLLPNTGNSQKDLQIFEALMAFDEVGLARRAVFQKKVKPHEIAEVIELAKPWRLFTYKVKALGVMQTDFTHSSFPLNAAVEGVEVKWRSETTDDDKALMIQKYFLTLSSYEEKSLLGKRPEEVDQAWLYKPIWEKVNAHLMHLGVNAHSHQELVEQLGILRFGHRPKVGDTFAGGGSIPFEAARLGCEAHASDLNPIACMLNWGNFNIIGATLERKNEIQSEQSRVVDEVNKEVLKLGIETNEYGDRAKAFLYCLEVTCPETGWKIPLSSTWVISKNRSVIAILHQNNETKSFDIKIIEGVSDQLLEQAEVGTVQNGYMVYELDQKKYRVAISTLRGDFQSERSARKNMLRAWEKSDFRPRNTDIFHERLYCIHWIKKDDISLKQETYFASITPEDLQRESTVEEIVACNLTAWQDSGFVPDMKIERGDKTDEPIRTRGWTYWHHLFSPRNLLIGALFSKNVTNITALSFLDVLNFNSKLCRWTTSGKRIAKDGSGKQVGGASDNATDVFSNQALNTNYNYAFRSAYTLFDSFVAKYSNRGQVTEKISVTSVQAAQISNTSDYWITDPPYADAVMYHEITEYFIAWLRKNPPAPFNEWTWDSRRALAIKGSGDDFRRGMIEAYTAMAKHMPDNGMQCVMFTHQDTSVWSDMVGIFWAAGLQVVSAWYIATETSSELKKGGYVQGTVTLMLRKRPAGEKAGFKQRILPAVRNEVESQIKQMMHLNNEVKEKMGEPVFNDSDLQMAGYAAALKVLTAYTSIGGEDVTTFALRPRIKGEVTVVDEIVQQASEAANLLLVPEGLQVDSWRAISGIQRFYLRMMDMETTGASKLDNYQNFAKAFRVVDYTKVMGSMTANKAHLKPINEFNSRDLTDSTEIGPTPLGNLIIALQQLLIDTEPQAIITQLQEDIPDYMELRPVLIDITNFIVRKSDNAEVRRAAEILSGRMRTQRALGQD